LFRPEKSGQSRKVGSVTRNLTVSDNSPLAPGETRTVEVTASDAAWEVYRLADLIYDPDSRFAGLLFFWDESGNRQLVTVDAPLIPTFI
jgi:methane/ammonia monooxygenase subunit B